MNMFNPDEPYTVELGDDETLTYYLTNVTEYALSKIISGGSGVCITQTQR